MQTFDSIIIGAGQAGPSLAAALVARGQRVALAEGYLMGGSCVNYGCIPTKTLIASARAARMIQRSAEYGLHVDGLRVDFGAVMARVHARRSAAREGLEGWLEGLEGLTLYRSYAQFTGTQDGLHHVQVGDEVIAAPHVYLNVGTRAFVPPIEGLADVPHLDSEGVLNLQALPRHLLILGGSYIGLEMGLAFRRLGAQVTIIEGGPHIIGREDDDVIAEATRILQAEGVTLLTGHKALRAEARPDGLALTLSSPAGQPVTVEGSHWLLAVGRKPNSDRLNLASIGLATDGRGFIPTDDALQTAIPGIWALGDVNGRGAFTHTSYHDHQIIVDNLSGAGRTASARTMAYALYIDPPLGRVGLTEREVRASGRPALMAVKPMNQIGRALEQGETSGLMKLIVDVETERFLGACVFGYQGDDVIQVISHFMATGASYRVMRDALPIHPTIAEFLPSLLNELRPLA
jgi:pyruvate/2-oxoglutarate dehydrogenase complex dihydrolipoamide dehydrogenase (E3) component